jgi:hypothetical protein
VLIALGNMRANGVRTLAAWCLGRGCASANAIAMSAKCQLTKSHAWFEMKEAANRGGLLELHELNFSCLTYRALKGSHVASWSIGLNASEPHQRAAYEA